MESILWSLGRADGVEILGQLWRPFVIGLVLYYSGYLGVWLQTLARAAGLIRFRPLAPADAVDVLVVIPTLLKTRDDVDSLRDAAATVVDNRYPGRVALVMAIDGSDESRHPRSSTPSTTGSTAGWTGTRANTSPCTSRL